MNNILVIIYFFLIFILMIFSYFYLLPYLKKLKFGQSIRKEGPRSHYIKSGTPTIGGIIIFITFLLSLILFIVLFKNLSFTYSEILDFILILFVMIGYFIIGLIDDLLIIIKKNNKGLSPLLKFALELIISILFYFLYLYFNKSTKVSFFNLDIELFFLYGPFICLIFTSCTNATNLTDGLDGLLSMSILPVIVGFIFMGMLFGNNSVVIVSVSMLISIIIFLFFNFSKAKLFMGDTGSLMLGGYLGVMAIILNIPFILLIFGFIFVIETLSVILQVYFFKRTKGKRLFKMSPIHHHLELSGFKETTIAILYFIISTICVVVGVVLKLVI